MMVGGQSSKIAMLLLGAVCCGNASEVLVTCGSVIKIRHEASGYHLHSHSIKWGGGSGQQSVTAHGSEDDQGSMWIVKEADGAMPCEAGEPVLCGNAVRLEHLLTGKNLHSHTFMSPLSRNQEVSCFGDAGEGDSSDSWVVECARKGGDQPWTKSSSVKLRHLATRKYLHATTGSKFTQQNCPNCPIVGQIEVAAASGSGSSTNWKAEQGVYLSPA